ncbi:TetR family transcriptional regulator [Nocardioides sp.]|uniref:TetR/AcrR family transcriptional regulator n=1 Tax=Nocardioides sp. TaxID=35761 RepID=UPI0031FE9239|nr:TetR/AcrR family transcriptional regulator [Nocardioides sp.]
MPPNTEPEITSRAAAAARTKTAILDAARRLFVTHGYGETSVRAIAGEAGVDPALVIRHFGSKEKLFLDTVTFRDFFAHVTAGPLEGMGARIVANLRNNRVDPTFSAYRAMMRASDSDLVRERLVSAMQVMFVEPLAPRLEGPDAVLRARLIAAQVGGLIDAIAILGDPVIAGADSERLETLFGAAIQTLIEYRD